MLLLLLASALAQDCDDPDRSLDRAERSVASYYLVEAASELEAAEAAFACGPPATAGQVARLLAARGAIAFLRQGGPEDVAESTGAFARARALAPDSFPEDFGPLAREAWAAAPANEATGTVEVRNIARGEWVRIDGEVMASPAEVPVGPHLVQVGAGDRARYAAQAWVEADGSVTVGPPALAVAPTASAPPDAAASAPPDAATPTSVPGGAAGTKRVVGISTAGVGLALLGGATVYYQTRLRGKEDDDARAAYFTTWVPLTGSGAALTLTGTLVAALARRPRGRRRR
ncbi:MAG: hypothetical protein ACI8PZ_001612 [Myxococcota bacterium]|jgi:hypothetical protein